MKDPDIQAATASEPLTLDEEYAMQKSWHLDDDKLTFIILERYHQAAGIPNGQQSHAGDARVPVDLRTGMIGDVNLFLSQDHEQGEEGSTRLQGELEIMIAEHGARRKGYATQALKLMISYAMYELKLSPADFLVRIGTANKASIAVFEQLGFGITKQVAVFEEVEMRVDSGAAQLSQWTAGSEIEASIVHL